MKYTPSLLIMQVFQTRSSSPDSRLINNPLHFFNIMLYFYSLYISNGAKVM